MNSQTDTLTSTDPDVEEYVKNTYTMTYTYIDYKSLVLEYLYTNYDDEIINYLRTITHMYNITVEEALDFY